MSGLSIFSFVFFAYVVWAIDRNIEFCQNEKVCMNEMNYKLRMTKLLFPYAATLIQRYYRLRLARLNCIPSFNHLCKYMQMYTMYLNKEAAYNIKGGFDVDDGIMRLNKISMRQCLQT